MQLRRFLPSSFFSRLTLGIVFCEALIVIVLESLIYTDYQRAVISQYIPYSPGRGIPVYLIIFVFSQVFQFILVWDAVVHKNTIQIIGFAVSNLCCFIFSIFQFSQIQDSLKTGFITVDSAEIYQEIKLKLIGVTIVTGGTEIAYLYLGWQLYKDFGWQIYKKIGADPQMKNMYRAYQIFLMLLKLDIFFFLGFSIQFLVLILQPGGDIEFPLTILAIPLTIAILLIAVWSVRHESRTMMIIFLMGLVGGMIYFIFKLVRMYDPSQELKYQHIVLFLTAFAVLSFIALVLTFVNAIVCWMNFGKGLKQHLLHTSGAEYTQTNPTRIMSIE
ncbi:uncharacterized protein VTP21DRAFT_88 [Calcarisporiella thermophila]|uniref:uncharacterized protein n=1 Tax=Calcarisporiella thermophila TaxID=911321 RepID=UPI0037440FF1